MMAILLVLFFHLFSSGIKYASCDVCNPIECFSEISKIFQEADDKDSCTKLTNIEQCFQLCHPVSNDGVGDIVKGIQGVKEEACKHDQDNKLSNKCVDKHKYLFLSCLYESFNINAISSNTDPKLLMCRKITEAEHCDLSTLVPCSRHSNYVAEVLLEKLFDPLHKEFCRFTEKQIYELNVTYPVFANDYKNLALCFDTNSHLVEDCISHKGAKNSVISSFFSYKLCKSVDSFISCLQNIVRNRCPTGDTAFRIISNSLYQNVLPKCFPYSNSNKASKENLFDMTYVDSGGNNVKNKSDKVILYQHVEDRHSNGNIVFISFFSLFCVFLPILRFLMHDYVFPS